MTTATFLSLLPALFWLLYLRSLAHYRSYSAWDFLLALAAGALSPSLVFAVGSMGIGGAIPHGIWNQLYFFIVQVGWVEEMAKMLMAFLFLRFTGRLKEPLDGLLLGGCVALGFATSENVLYVERAGESVLIGRAILATFGHVLMSSFWGYPLAQKGWKGLFSGLVAASLVHGFYDWFLVIGWPLFAVGTLLIAWSVFRFRLVHANLTSRSRVLLAYQSRECPRCGALTRWSSKFCTNCAHPFEGQAEKAYCSQCLESVPVTETCCPGCSRKLLN